jgi:hypothetical protein
MSTCWKSEVTGDKQAVCLGRFLADEEQQNHCAADDESCGSLLSSPAKNLALTFWEYVGN